MGVSANFGAKINTRKRAVRIDPDVMKDVGTKWGNKRDGVCFKVVSRSGHCVFQSSWFWSFQTGVFSKWEVDPTSWLGSCPNVVIMSVFQRGKADVGSWVSGLIMWDVMWLFERSREVMWCITWLVWEQVKITQVNVTWNRARYNTWSQRRLEMRGE